MKLLLDTNIWLELFLDRPNAQSVRRLFAAFPPKDIAVSDFSLDSIAVILVREHMQAPLLEFFNDIVIRNRATVLTASVSEKLNIVGASSKLGLDYDDAYQYTVAEKFDLTLVSFDRHFDKTPRGRKIPDDLIAGGPAGAS